jgi:hypothetical protein
MDGQGERAALKLLERVVAIAADAAGPCVYLEFGVEPLSAVPLDGFRTTRTLHSAKWPQVLAEIGAKRSKREAATRRRKKRN